MLSLLQLDPQTYRSHALHDPARAYPETNCYADILIELVHARGDEPLAMLGGTIRTDFEGDQWTFFKPAPQDLERLFGIDIHEMQLYRPLPDQIEEQLRAGRTVIVELDSWFLPDTQSTAYRREHVKSSAVIEGIDVAAERLRYFHNTGLFELSGDDFRGSLRLDDRTAETSLPPYLEIVRFDAGQRLDGDALKAASRSLFEEHFDHRPDVEPVRTVRRLSRGSSSEPAGKRPRVLPHLRVRDRADGRLGVRSVCGPRRMALRCGRCRRSPVARNDHQRLQGVVVQAGTPARLRRRSRLRAACRRLGRRDRRPVEAPRLDVGTTPRLVADGNDARRQIHDCARARRARLARREPCRCKAATATTTGFAISSRQRARARSFRSAVLRASATSTSTASTCCGASRCSSRTSLPVPPGAHELTVCARALDPLLEDPAKASRPVAVARAEGREPPLAANHAARARARVRTRSTARRAVARRLDRRAAAAPRSRQSHARRRAGVLQIETDPSAGPLEVDVDSRHDGASGRRRRAAGARREALVAAHARRPPISTPSGSARTAANWCAASGSAS